MVGGKILIFMNILIVIVKKLIQRTRIYKKATFFKLFKTYRWKKLKKNKDKKHIKNIESEYGSQYRENMKKKKIL